MSYIIFSKLESLPEFLTTSQLINIGLYPSNNAAYIARAKGQSPNFIQVNRKVLYPKSSVLNFIERHMRLHDSSASTTNK